MTTKYFTENQPRDGQTVLHCEHIRGKPAHFFTLGDGMPFHRPDGSNSVAHWIAICDDCFAIHKNSPIGAVTEDSSWIGNAPVIKQDAQ